MPASEIDDLRALLSEQPEAFQVNAFIDQLMRPLLLDAEAAGGGGGGGATTGGGKGGGKGPHKTTAADFGFDPVALHDLFTVTLDRLAKLGKEADERIGTVQEEGTRAAPQRKKELDRHHRSLQEVHETIEDIETHFRKVGLTAVRIGQSLSQTEFQRQKAEHAQHLLEYFLAFDTLKYDAMLKDAESERIEMLSNDVLAPLSEDANYQAAAAILSDLNVICEDLNAPHLENAVRCIRVFGERLEKRLLDKFEAAAMAEEGGSPTGDNAESSLAVLVGGTPDMATMRDCAASLLKFGDAVKLYNTYIYTIVAKQVQAQAARRQGNGADDADEMRDALSEFFGLISALCQKAFTLIRQVFPPSASLKVTRMLIDRMVNDPAFGIQVRVAEVLDDGKDDGAGGGGHGLSVSDSLDMLLMVHDKTNALATDLIEHCEEAEKSYLEDRQQGAARRGDGVWLGEDGENPDHDEDRGAADDAAGGATAAAAATAAAMGGRWAGAGAAAASSSSRSQEALSSYVKIQFAELFVGQRESYLEKEVSLLRMRLVNGLAQVVGPEVGLTSGAPEAGGRGGSAVKPAKKMPFGNRGGGATEDAELLPALRHDKVENYDVMLQNWLRKEVLASFLDHCRDALSRNAKMFRKDDERADNVLVMLSVVHKFLATSVLLPSLSAASNIVQQPSTGAPPPTFYQVLAAVHAWVDTYKEFFKTTALPEVHSKPTTQTVLLESCRKFLARVERAGAKTIERGVDAIMRTVERIHRELLTKTDYLAKDNTVTELQATRACLTLRDCLHHHIGLLRQSLPPNDVRVIVAVLAHRVQALLMSRVKQLRINTSGALVLMQDVEIIQGCFTVLYTEEEEEIDATKKTTTGSGASAPAVAAAAASAPLIDNVGEIKAAFDELKEVVGLFIVPPANLVGLLDHGYLATQDRNELFLYISMRADFRTHGMISPWVRKIFADVREDAIGGEEEMGGRHLSAPRASSPLPGGGSPSKR